MNLKARLAYWQHRLRLQEWNLTLKLHRGERRIPGSDNAAADVEWDVGSMSAVVSLATDRTDAENDSCLLHEVLYVNQAELVSLAFDLTEQLSPQACAVARKELDRVAERVILRLERAFMEK